jgi:putative spermidine/putrescine transport system substrate-binding protein
MKHPWQALLAAALLMLIGGTAWAEGVTMAAYGGGNGETWRKGVQQQFTDATHVSAKVVDVPDTEAALRASVASPQYNVAWVTAFSAANLFRDGLLQTFDPKDFPDLAGLPDADLMRAPDGRLIGIPVQFQFYSIAFNTAQAKASDFPSWHSLGDPAWKGRIAVPQAYIAASYDVPMLAHIAGKDAETADALAAYKPILANAFTTLSSFAQGNLLLSRGEVAALPFYSARIAALKQSGAAVDITLPKEGGLMLPYLLVVPKNAIDLPAAEAWLKAAIQPDAQLRMFDISGYLPFSPKAVLSPAQTSELGSDLPTLRAKLYEPDWWAVSAGEKALAGQIEQMQAALH